MRLKAMFIMLANVYWVAVLIYGINLGMSTGLWNYGLIASGAVPAGFIGFLMLFRSLPRTSANLFIITVVVIGSVAWTWVLYYQDGFIPIVLSSLSLIVWLIYIYWYSRFPNREHPLIEHGKKLPDLQFTEAGGERLNTYDLKGKKVIYLFYRGNWCPLCMAQIKEIAGQYRELADRGVEVLLISPQPQKNTKALADKYKIPFHFLVDENNRMASKLGILDKGGLPLGFEVLGYDSDTVLPTVIITDEKQIVFYLDKTDNYRVRPEPETFIKVIERMI